MILPNFMLSGSHNSGKICFIYLFIVCLFVLAPQICLELAWPHWRQGAVCWYRFVTWSTWNPLPGELGTRTFTSPSSGTHPPCSHVSKSPLRAGKMKLCIAFQQVSGSTLLSAHFSRLFELFLFLYSTVVFIPNKSGGTFFKEQVVKPTFLRKTFLQKTVNMF